MTHRQLPLDFNAVQTYFVEDFVVSKSNQIAHDTILNWPNWPSNGFLIYGDKKVGKTHLAHIFRHHAKAVFVHQENLQQLDQFSRFIQKDSAFIVDDAHTFVPRYQTQLFHLCNIIKEKESYVLWTADRPAQAWDVQLKDLSSRLLAFPAVRIAQPEDALLEALLVKKLSEMQIEMNPSVSSFILTHTERSAEFLISFLEKLNHLSLSEKRKVTIPFIKEVMQLQV